VKDALDQLPAYKGKLLFAVVKDAGYTGLRRIEED
jgi:hypothetical protein